MPKKQAISKPQFIDLVASHVGITKADAAKFIDGYEAVVVASLKAHGEVTLPGLVKILTKEMPATAERQKLNPFTKQMVTVKPKPAFRKVRAKVLTSLKKAVG